jgi:hypothetical protein
MMREKGTRLNLYLSGPTNGSSIFNDAFINARVIIAEIHRFRLGVKEVSLCFAFPVFIQERDFGFRTTENDSGWSSVPVIGPEARDQ